MAQGSNVEYVLKRMRADNIRNFSVFDGDKKTVIEQCKDNSLTVDGAIDRLRDTLEFCSGLVFVELCPLSKEERAGGGVAAKNPNYWIPVQCGGSLLTRS
jgi:hypothetical protein